MPAKTIAIGPPEGPQHVLYGSVTFYNPSDDYTQALAMACTAIAAEHLEALGRDGIHAWMREHFPGSNEMLKYVEAGQPVPGRYKQGDWPITPGSERGEIPLVEELKQKL